MLRKPLLLVLGILTGAAGIVFAATQPPPIVTIASSWTASGAPFGVNQQNTFTLTKGSISAYAPLTVQINNLSADTTTAAGSLQVAFEGGFSNATGVTGGGGLAGSVISWAIPAIPPLSTYPISANLVIDPTLNADTYHPDFNLTYNSSSIPTPLKHGDSVSVLVRRLSATADSVLNGTYSPRLGFDLVNGSLRVRGSGVHSNAGVQLGYKQGEVDFDITTSSPNLSDAVGFSRLSSGFSDRENW